MIRTETIGDATLYCGNCFDVLSMLPPVDHLIADPPYESSHHNAKNNVHGRLRKDGGTKMRSLDFEAIDEIRDAFVEEFGTLCPKWFIVFCTAEGVARWADAINPSDALRYKRACVWIKPDSAPQLNGQGPGMGAEMFVTAWGGPSYSAWNAGGKRGVYTHNIKGPARDGRHPTEKPVPLMSEIIGDFTAPGETILDPFAGSGSTGVAALSQGRKFIGIERDPKYFEIMCERIAKAWAQPRLFDDAAAVGRAKTPDMFREASQ